MPIFHMSLELLWSFRPLAGAFLMCILLVAPQLRSSSTMPSGMADEHDDTMSQPTEQDETEDDITSEEQEPSESEEDEALPSCGRCGAAIEDGFTPLHCLMCDKHLCESCSECSGVAHDCMSCSCEFDEFGDGHSACRLCLAAQIREMCCGCAVCHRVSDQLACM